MIRLVGLIFQAFGNELMMMRGTKMWGYSEIESLVYKLLNFPFNNRLSPIKQHDIYI